MSSVNIVLDEASKRLLQFGVVGLVIAASLMVVVEYRPSGIIPVNGTLLIEITDAPPSGVGCGNFTVPSLNITIDSVRVHTQGLLDMSGQWSEVFQGEKTIDIARLTSTSEVFGPTSISETTITTIRIHVRSAMAELSGSPCGTVPVTVPDNGDLKIPLKSVNVRAGRTTDIIIDFLPHVVCEGKSTVCRLTPVLSVKSVRGPE